MSAQSRLAELGIELPTPMVPAGLYRAAVRVGDLVFLSGAGHSAQKEKAPPPCCHD